MTSTFTVAVHGSTGVQGAAVAGRLRSAGHAVRAIARSSHPSVDLADAASLARVYRQADAVVVSLPLTFGANALAYADAVITALAASAVPRVVFNANGPYPAGEIGVPFLDARARVAAALQSLPAQTTLVRPAATYMDNFAAPWARPRIIEQRVVAYPVARELALPWTALDDLAQLIVELVAEASPPEEIVLAGEPLTGDEVAAELGVALGQPIRWESVSPAAYGTMMRPFAGEEAAEGIAAMYTAAAEGPPPPAPDSRTVRRAPTSLRAWAAQHLASA